MLTCRIELTGKTTDELLLALEQVQKQIDEGHGSGVNYVNGEAGHYSFKVASEDEAILMYCQSCEYEGDANDFSPTDGDPSPFICPECSGTKIFTKD